MRVLNTNVGGAYTTPEILWFMEDTKERCALRASNILIYSLQENGMKPDKQILQILRSRRAFTEGTLLIPARVVILPDYIANPTRWNGSVATLFAARDPPRNSTLIATSNPSTIQTPSIPHPITTIEGSEGNEPLITRLLQRSLGNTPTQLITTNALEPSTLISISDQTSTTQTLSHWNQEKQ